jgi:NAD(P)-dependent dehydrogenase (short-subunit alcohol dehydrogenase family)
VVVTGGRGALGSVVAERLAAGGARVAVLERRAPPPESAAPLPAGLERIAPADLVDEASVRDAIGRAAVRFGGLDTLVNVAGGFVWESFE